MRRLLALLVLLPALALAAPPTVTITGSVRDPSGAGVTSGRITCKLSQPGSVLDGATSVRVAAQTTITLLPGGTLPATAKLVPNKAITPTGTAYVCTFSVVLAAGLSTSWTETWQLPTVTTLPIGDVPRLNIAPGAPIADQAVKDAQQDSAFSVFSTGQVSRDIGQDAALTQARADFTAGGGGFGDATNITATGTVTPRPLAKRASEVPTPQDFGASGSALATTGSITAGTATLTVASAQDFVVGQGISIAGAGPAGALFVTAIQQINGLTFTLAANASTNVGGAAVNHDDTAGIQLAVNTLSAGATPYMLFFPKGTYRTSSTITLPTAVPFRIYGTGQVSHVVGSVAGWIFYHFGNTYGVTEFSNMRVQNLSTAASAGAIYAEGVQAILVEHMNIESSGGWGMDITGWSGRVAASRILGGPSGVGIYTGGHLNIENCDVTGWGEGVRMSGAGVSIIGGRYEVNVVGIRVGVNRAGTTWASSRGGISGISMEANDTAINVVASSNFFIKGVGHQGSVNAPSGRSLYGLKITAGDPVISASSFTGEYTNAAVYVSAIATPKLVHVTATNSFAGPGATDWDVRVNPHSMTIVGASSPDIGGKGIGEPDYIAAFATQGITRLDMLNGTVTAKNIRGKNVPVGAAAVSVAVTFPPVRGAGQAAINTATATAGAGLADGTYYYCGTVVTEMGESSCFPEKSVVLAAPNNQATLSFFGMGGDTAWRRRVYRGTAAGVYDGFYELPLASSASFIDTGTAFSGVKGIISAGDTPSGAEADANYAVTCSPQWNATCWVSGKATTGFTLNFSAAPGGGGSFVDWHLIR